MADSTAATVNELVLALGRAVASGSANRVVAIADQILELDPHDADALRCKLVALVKDSAFEAAIAFLDESSALKGAHFERAYCFFRLNRFDEALKVLQAVERMSPLMVELKAQILYRKEEYSEARSIYEELQKSEESDLAEERETNLLAATAGLASASPDPGSVTVTATPSSYEQAYNLGCIALAQGRASDCLDLLDGATTMCREVLEEEGVENEDEIDEELALLRVQSGVALQKLGRESEAMKRFTHVLKTKPSDAVLCAIAAVNIVALNKDRNVFDSRKKMNLVNVDAVLAKLTKVQRRSIAINEVLMLLHMNQPEPCKKKLDDFDQAHPGTDLPSLIRSSLLARQKKDAESFAELQHYAEKNSSTADRMKLAIAQVQLGKGDVDAAVATLDTIEALENRPAVVGALVRLHTVQGNVTAACARLDAAVRAWKECPDSQQASSMVAKMRLATADFKFAQHLYSDAATLYQEQFESQQDADSLIRLIACLSEFDVEGAERYAEQLPPLEFDDAEIDASALEAAIASHRREPRAVKTALRATDSGGAADGAASAIVAGDEPEVKRKRARKKRPGKLPKNFNPNIPPDPERWLPKWERTEWKRKHRKRAGLHYQVARGTQGTSNAVPEAPKGSASDQTAAAATPSQKPSRSASGDSASGASPTKAVQSQSQTKKKKKNKKKK